jgi:outer membrane lipoprotein SlyB
VGVVHKRKSEKMNLFERQTLAWGAVGFIAFTFIANSVKADTQVQDHYKNIIYKTPSQVEVCYDRNVSGDKTGDAIKGAIIGGILGNNIKGEKDGGAIGAIIGGMLGHSNSNASSGTKRVCQVETRYTEESRRVYSHSTISFIYEGKSYRVNFKK